MQSADPPSLDNLRLPMHSQTSVLFVVLAAVFLSSCQPAAPSSTRGAIVYGESRTGTADAAKAAQNAIDNAAGSGCRPISIGSGAYAGAGEQGGGQLVNVVVLLECPAGVKVLAATGARVP